MKLVDWAKSKDITYKKTFGPLEFCKMINVDSAVKAGEIHILRYKAYLANMEEIKSKSKY